MTSTVIVNKQDLIYNGVLLTEERATDSFTIYNANFPFHRVLVQVEVSKETPNTVKVDCGASFRKDLVNWLVDEDIPFTPESTSTMSTPAPSIVFKENVMPNSKLQAALDCLKEDMPYSWYVGYIQQAFKKEYWNEMTVSELEYSQLINTL